MQERCQQCFAVVECGDKWVVCASGVMVLTCQNKRMAMAMAREAARLLVESQPDKREADCHAVEAECAALKRRAG